MSEFYGTFEQWGLPVYLLVRRYGVAIVIRNNNGQQVTYRKVFLRREDRFKTVPSNRISPSRFEWLDFCFL